MIVTKEEKNRIIKKVEKDSQSKKGLTKLKKNGN